MSELRSAAGETLEFEVGPVERDDPPFEIASSSGATVTTVENHGYQQGDLVRVVGHIGNSIGGTHYIETVLGVTSFTLAGVNATSTGARTGTVTRIVPVDLTAVGTIIDFAARVPASELVFLEKTSQAGDGVALNVPSSARKNLATVTIDAADTAGIEYPEDLYFDVWLTEPAPGLRRTRLDRGIWKISPAVA